MISAFHWQKSFFQKLVNGISLFACVRDSINALDKSSKDPNLYRRYALGKRAQSAYGKYVYAPWFESDDVAQY